MATRTVKMYGKAYGKNVSLQASFNGSEILNGPVASTDQPVDQSIDWNNLDVVTTFSLDSSVSGNVAFTATVTGGSFVFHTFHADYCGDIVEIDEQGNNTVTTSSADHINDISFDAESPDTGHSNIVIAGESRTRDLVTHPEALGMWNWTINDGETMSMNILVSPVE